jgi:hypothetical protein
MLEHAAQLLVGEIHDAGPGRDTCAPKSLVAPDVADSRHEALVEKRIANGALRLTAQARSDGPEVGRVGEDVQAEARDGTRAEREDGTSSQHRALLPSLEDEPRAPAHRLGLRLQAPTARHAEVTAQHDAAVEAEQEVLAVSIDREQPAAVYPLGDTGCTRPRMKRAHTHPLAGQGLKRPGRAMNGVAFGHYLCLGTQHGAARSGHEAGLDEQRHYRRVRDGLAVEALYSHTLRAHGADVGDESLQRSP